MCSRTSSDAVLGASACLPCPHSVRLLSSLVRVLRAANVLPRCGSSAVVLLTALRLGGQTQAPPATQRTSGGMDHLKEAGSHDKAKARAAQNWALGHAHD
ncbi:hypothetical protein GCM10010357_20950 [Streptomyces luteireticuli]|uniref:Uncharacterized protein n=1 Tax=Streptomyces luteireticuli TaxID=173858 RepID=A0ABN0YLS0_9ACTN